MAYEYRSGSQTLELPNPYTIENRIRFITGSIFAVAGFALLLAARHDFLGRSYESGVFPIVIGLGLMAYGALIIVGGLTQLRFFFGRERPGTITVNMAPLQQSQPAQTHERPIPEVPSNQEGESDPARALEETIRRGALPFAEPKGPLNGVLYRLYRELIYAVPPLQRLAQKQFRIAVTVCAVLLAFALSWILATQAILLQRLAIVFFAIAVFSVLLPLDSEADPNPEKIRLFTVFLVAAAVLLPALLMLFYPHPIQGLHPALATLLLLILTGSAAALFFNALRAQLGEPPPASSSVHQVAMSMNCHPSQLSEELARTLQSNWREQIPNRHYMNKQPQINTAQQGSGKFDAEVLEETQPLPVKSKPPQSFPECLADPVRRPVLWLQLFGAALLIFSAVGLAFAAWWYTTGRLETQYAAFLNLMTYIVVAFAVGRYCFNGGHRLFGRFDFESVVYWVECRGTYQVASAGFGNVLSDRIHTKKSVINVETATLRAWVVELQTIVFSKDGKRYIRAMMGRKDEARDMAEALVAFAGTQSVVVAPTSSIDVEKIAGMAQLSTSPPGAVSRETLAAALPNSDSPGAEHPAPG